VVAAWLGAGAPGADAAPARELSVLLLRPAHPSTVAAEAFVRLRGELLAAGYAVELADVPEHGSVRTAMAPPARPAGTDAVVALFGDDAQGPGLLWVVDRATGKTVTRPIPHDAEGTRGAQILSVRALELLRASFLEAALAPGAPTAVARAPAATAPPPPNAEAARPPTATPGPGPTAARPVPASPVAENPRPGEPAAGPTIVRRASPPAPGPRRIAVEAGGFVLGSLDGVPPAVLPLLRATLVPVLRWPLRARVTVAGLGTRARVNGTDGDADVSHQLALAEALWGFRPGRRWQPFLSVGAGATYVSARGLPPAGATTPMGRTASSWAFVADAGAGLHVALAEQLQLAGEAHVEADAPYPAIRFLGKQLATEGRPTLLASLSLLAWF